MGDLSNSLIKVYYDYLPKSDPEEGGDEDRVLLSGKAYVDFYGCFADGANGKDGLVYAYCAGEPYNYYTEISTAMDDLGYVEMSEADFSRDGGEGIDIDRLISDMRKLGFELVKLPDDLDTEDEELDEMAYDPSVSYKELYYCKFGVEGIKITGRAYFDETEAYLDAQSEGDDLPDNYFNEIRQVMTELGYYVVDDGLYLHSKGLRINHLMNEMFKRGFIMVEDDTDDGWVDKSKLLDD